MPRILFVAYDFPPCRNLGGSLRSAALIKRLRNRHWHATVIARKEKGIAAEMWTDVIRVESLTPWSKPYEVSPYGWAFTAIRRAKQLDRTARFDLVYVSCPPFPQALAFALAKQFQDRPLIVDFRDAWALDPYREGSRLKRYLYLTLFPRLEHQLIQRADALILNTPSACKAYAEKYPGAAKRMHYLPNGYEEHLFPDACCPVKQGKTLNLLYSGRFGIGARDPSSLFEAIAYLIAEKLPLRLNIIGSQPSWIEKRVRDLQLEDKIILHPPVAHADVVQHLLGAHVLVLFQAPSTGVLQAVAGKTYEYIRTGRPILAIAPPGDNLDIIKDYTSRYELVAGTDVELIIAAIRRLHDDWQANKICQPGAIPEEFLESFGWNKLAGDMADIFNKAMET